MPPAAVVSILLGWHIVRNDAWTTHIGYLAGNWLTMGMLLTTPMIFIGIAVMAYAYRRNVPTGNLTLANA